MQVDLQRSPNREMANDIRSFLDDAPWISRRIETVTFLDLHTVRREVTLDIDWNELQSRPALGDFRDDSILVPLTMLSKGLLVDFDLKDAAGCALPVIPRPDDSFMAWTTLFVLAEGVLSGTAFAPNCQVARHLWTIVHNFPSDSDDRFDVALHSWNSPDDWTDNDNRMWQSLMESDFFTKSLRDFTFNYILATRISNESAKTPVIKFSYLDEPTFAASLNFWQRMNMEPTDLAVSVPAVGWPRSFHIRIKAPEDLEVMNVELFDAVETEDLALAENKSTYRRRITSQSAHIYVTDDIPMSDYGVGVETLVPLKGYLNAMWAMATLVTIVLLGTLIFSHRLIAESNSDQQSAAVTLVLVIQSLMSVYLVRPNEHPITSRSLRRLRVLIVVSGFLSFISAGILIVARTTDMHDFPGIPDINWATFLLFLLVLVQVLITVVFCVVGYMTSRAFRVRDAEPPSALHHVTYRLLVD